MTWPRSPRFTKDCPGRCGTRTNQSNLVCSNCWELLPRPLRDEIMSWQGKRGEGARLNRLRLRREAHSLLREAHRHA